MMASQLSKIVVDRITARVFCYGPSGGGGNPVTIFASSKPLSRFHQIRLAKECEWESVMVSTAAAAAAVKTTDETKNSLQSSTNPIMAFYMPSGTEVNFCAHAALGGAYAALLKPNQTSQGNRECWLETNMDRHMYRVTLPQQDDKEAMTNVACLHMTNQIWEEHPVSHRPLLHRLLREHLGLTSSQSAKSYCHGKLLPTFCNSSIARPKTLVPVQDLSTLRNLIPPKITPGKRTSFEMACSAIDDSTGIYVYTNRDNEPTVDDGEIAGSSPAATSSSWECRQFPRASGYPEDPATGIAAAALAVSLFRRGFYDSCFNFYQGISMDRPSLIQITDVSLIKERATFGIRGRIEIDDRQEMHLPDETNDESTSN